MSATKSSNQSGNGNGRNNSGAGGVNAANARDINIVHTDGRNFCLHLLLAWG